MYYETSVITSYIFHEPPKWTFWQTFQKKIKLKEIFKLTVYQKTTSFCLLNWIFIAVMDQFFFSRYEKSFYILKEKSALKHAPFPGTNVVFMHRIGSTAQVRHDAVFPRFVFY